MKKGVNDFPLHPRDGLPMLAFFSWLIQTYTSIYRYTDLLDVFLLQNWDFKGHIASLTNLS